MARKTTDIQKLVNLLAVHVKFKLDYRAFLNKERKLLIVEGKTDQDFIKKVQSETVDCIVAANVFKSNAQFRTSDTGKVNCKNAIVIIITGISHYPSPFIQYPEKMDEWDTYGLVDKDCEELQFQRPTPRLFITDTHDLETLLLSTDDELLSRLKECKISKEDIERAYFIAYQLAETRTLLDDYHEELDLRVLSGGSSDIRFYEFLENDRININRLISYISSNSKEPLSGARIKKLCSNVCRSKSGKKLYDATGLWRHSLSDFISNIPADFWDEVNGHDILQLLMFINETAFAAFGDSQGYTLNRSFEMSLIAAYEYSNFSKTNLKKRMIQEGLLTI